MMQGIILTCWAIFLGFWVIKAFSNKPTIERQNFSNRLWWGILFFFSFVLLYKGVKQSELTLNTYVLPQLPVISMIGVILVIGGLALALWARVVLGSNWSGTITFKKNHELIQQGPYAWVRHPIYTALIIMYLGTAIFYGVSGGFVGFILLVISCLIKLKQEETLLTKHFAKEYPAYKKRVKTLIPYIY